MADTTDPTPITVTVPDVPEPPVVAEAGVTTSEWKLALGFLAQAFAAVTLDAVNAVAAAAFHASVNVPPALLDLAVKLEFAGAFVAGTYIVSRGVRKLYAK
jgi:hypothetical protein